MFNSLRIAATGMQAQQQNVDVLSNNIANLNTAAYKRSRAAFTDLMYENKIGVGAITSGAGTMSPTGAQIGLGVNLGSVYRIMGQGNVQQTGNVLDLAIQGRGFFQVQLPDGTTAYTRDGSFKTDNQGNITTKDGYLVQPNFVIPEDARELTISELGIVSVKVDDDVIELGQMTLTTFINEAGLEAIGNNFYLETEVSGAPTEVNPSEDGSGRLLQTYLEGSNVDPIQEITQLITAQRAYELNSRVISTTDEMLAAVNQIR